MAKSFSFAVLGDCKSDISLIHPEAFRQNIRTIDLLGSDFVVFLGDFVKGGHGRGRARGDEFYRTAGSLGMPYYLVVGNHDVQCRGAREFLLRTAVGPYVASTW